MPIHNAADHGHARIVEHLVTWGVPADARGARGRTVLHGLGDPPLARWLVTHGADVNARSDEGKTPLDVAVVPEVARVLRELGGRTAAELDRKPVRPWWRFW